MNEKRNDQYNAVEVGRLLLDYLVYDVNHTNGGSKEAPPCTQEEFRELEKSVTGDEQLSVYNIYRSLNTGIIKGFNYAASKLTDELTQAISLEVEIMKSCTAAEECFSDMLETTPYIVTERQKNALFKKARAYKGETLYTIEEVTLHSIQYFAGHISEAPEPLRGCLEALKNFKIVDRSVILNYTKAEKLGHYQLSDKTKVDPQDKAGTFWKSEKYLEMFETLNSPESQDIRQEILFLGVPGVQCRYNEVTGKRITTKKATMLYDELSENFSKSIKFPMYKLPTQESDRLYAPDQYIAKWRPCSALPRTETVLDIFEKHPESFTNADQSGEGEPNYKYIAETFPRLWGTALQYVKDNLCGDNAENEKELTFTRRYLAEKGFLDYSAMLEVKMPDLAALFSKDTRKDYIARKKILNSGIAIIYETAGQKASARLYSDYYDTLPINIDKVYKGTLGKISQQRKCNSIMRTFYYISAFNDLMDIFSDFAYAPNLKNLKIRAEWFSQYVQLYNKSAYRLYNSIAGSEKDRSKKKAIVKSLFQPIDIASTKPSKKAYKKMVEFLNDLNYNELLAIVVDFNALIKQLSEGRSEPSENYDKTTENA